MKKKLPIGIEFYEEFIDKDYYYVDKTLLIRELFDKGGKVNLFTRPRRFGKTLALTMLKTFFERSVSMESSENALDNRHYFDGMKIMKAGEQYTCHLVKYPVIFLSLKSAKQPDYDMACKSILNEIVREFERHRYVLEGNKLLESTRRKYELLMNGTADAAEYTAALLFLSACLKSYHGTNTIILVDEYDVPLENAYFKGFYDQMSDFIRSLFEAALKTNDSLELAVITGCLRISKESIFTGLNNLKVISILDESYAEYFGFTQSEVQDMLNYYGLIDKTEEVKHWYDGYLFGETEVYNPWSVINYIDTALSNSTPLPRPYWSNTSSNSIVRELVENADDSVKKEIELLIDGGSIEKKVHEDITYGDIHESQDNLWNFLFFTGYLKTVRQRFDVDSIYLTMMIPNMEIRYIYRNTIQEWFQRKLRVLDLEPLYQAIITGDSNTFESIVKEQLRESISYYDNAENFYHGFLMGLLGALQSYETVSNRESGDGRADIILKPYDEARPAIIMELKHAKKFSQMESSCSEALRQIEEKNYAAELTDFGYRDVIKYGICFCKKNCMIKMVPDSYA